MQFIPVTGDDMRIVSLSFILPLYSMMDICAIVYGICQTLLYSIILGTVYGATIGSVALCLDENMTHHVEILSNITKSLYWTSKVTAVFAMGIAIIPTHRGYSH